MTFIPQTLCLGTNAGEVQLNAMADSAFSTFSYAPDEYSERCGIRRLHLEGITAAPRSGRAPERERLETGRSPPARMALRKLRHEPAAHHVWQDGCRSPRAAPYAHVRRMLEYRHQELEPQGIPYVFPAGTKSGHVEHSTFRKQHAAAFKKLKESKIEQESKIEPFDLYSLRHTFATRIAPKCDAWSLCRIMGWTSLAVAMTYIHSSDDKVLEAFNGTGYAVEVGSFFGGHEFGHAALGDGLKVAVGA